MNFIWWWSQRTWRYFESHTLSANQAHKDPAIPRARRFLILRKFPRELRRECWRCLDKQRESSKIAISGVVRDSVGWRLTTIEAILKALGLCNEMQWKWSARDKERFYSNSTFLLFLCHYFIQKENIYTENSKIIPNFFSVNVLLPRFNGIFFEILTFFLKVENYEPSTKYWGKFKYILERDFIRVFTEFPQLKFGENLRNFVKISILTVLRKISQEFFCIDWAEVSRHQIKRFFILFVIRNTKKNYRFVRLCNSCNKWTETCTRRIFLKNINFKKYYDKEFGKKISISKQDLNMIKTFRIYESSKRYHK